MVARNFVKIALTNLFMHSIHNSLSRYACALFMLFSLPYAALAAAVPGDERVEVPTGAARAVTADDFRPHRATGSAYNEVWSYTFLLSDGMQATMSLSKADLGSLMSPVSGAEFSISGFDGATYRAAKQYGAEDLRFSPGTSKLEVHPNIYVEGALPQRHRVRFQAAKHGTEYEVDLTLSDIAAGLTWGDGVFQLGSQRVGMFIHIPYARVAGTVTIGGVTKRVSGTAYMDHTFQSDFATKLVRSAYRYVQHSGDMEVGYFIEPASRYENRVIGLAAVRRGGRFQLRKPESLQVVSTRPALGVGVPNQLAVRYAGGGQTIINRERDQQTFSALDELGGIQKAVAKQYVGGEAVVFRGRGSTNQRGRVVYDYLIVK